MGSSLTRGSLRKSDCLGCAVLLCLVVCLSLLASFFSSLIKTCVLTLWQVYELEGVVQLHNAHFWTLYTENYHGSLQLAVMAGTDTRRTLAAAKSILTQVGKFY